MSNGNFYLKCSITGVIFVAVLLVSCSWIEDPLPDEARVEIDVDGGEKEEIELIISDNFIPEHREITSDDGVVVDDTIEAVLLVADTSHVSLPYSERFDIGEHHRFYAKATRNMESNANIQMRGYIDGELEYEEESRSENERIMQFLYFFTQGEETVVRPTP